MSQKLARNIGIGLLAVVVVALLYHFQHHFIGKPPTVAYNAESHRDLAQKSVPHTEILSETQNFSDPDIERLRALSESQPDDPLVWQSLGETLLKKIGLGLIPKKAGAIEAIDALRKAIELNPENPKPVLMMADLSFDLRAFTKAKEFYEQYLSKMPEDALVKARYASTLTFLGQPKKARDVLTEVVASNPQDFQAHAFLTIAYAQLQDVALTKKWGDKALALAPHEEAREKLKQFLSGLQERALVETALEQKSEQKPEQKLEQNQTISPQDSSDKITVLDSYFKNHKIIGSKYRGLKSDGGDISVRVVDFPMSAMPDIAKNTLRENIKALLKGEDTKSVIYFIDDNSGEQLGEIILGEIKIE